MFRHIVLLFVFSALLVSGGCIRQKRGDVFDSMVDQFGTMSASDQGSSVELSEKDYFQNAINLFEQGSYMAAQQKFALFKKKFQYSNFVPASVFFQGECFFNSKVYIQASRYYRTIIEKYPFSSYVPQAAMKDGISMHFIGKSRKATQIFSDVSRNYPDTNYAKAAAMALKGSVNEAGALVSGVMLEPEVVIERKVTKTIISTPVQSESTEKNASCVSQYPNRYLLVIANSDYKYYGNLSYVKNDEAVLNELGSCYLGVPPQNIIVYKNTTFSELKRIFSHLSSIVRQKDSILFIYYTGHGVEDQQGNPFLIPVDASLKSEADLREGAVPLNYIQQHVAELEAGKKVFVWDACRVEVPWKLIHVKRHKDRNIAKDSTYIFATSSGKTSNISTQKSVSAFLDSLWEIAKAGTANFDFDSSGYVELNEIRKSLESRLRKTTTDKRQRLEIKGSSKVELFPVQ